MSFESDKPELKVPEPTLAEMTEKAIRVLRAHDNDKGFFLLVEGTPAYVNIHAVIFKIYY